MKKLVTVALLGGWMLSAALVHAQTTAPQGSTTHVISDQDIDLL